VIDCSTYRFDAVTLYSYALDRLAGRYTVLKISTVLGAHRVLRAFELLAEDFCSREKPKIRQNASLTKQVVAAQVDHEQPSSI